MQFSEEKSRKSADFFARLPFGVGDLPPAGIDFFNWGAFSQPLIWGVVQGVWPIVLAALAADVFPFLYLYLVPESSNTLIRVFLGYVIIQQLSNGIMRIWAGMHANRLLWQREAFLIKNLNGKSRFTFQQFIKRQFTWGKYGMIALVVQYIVATWLNYSQLKSAGIYPALIAGLLIAVWFVAVVIGARRVADGFPIGISLITGAITIKSHGETGHIIPQFFQQQKNTIKGIGLPSIGFGTYKIPEGDATKEAVLEALMTGYRHIDTASFYGNEVSVGEALREFGRAREDIFITTKIWNDQQGYARTVIACEESLMKLGVEYIDLLLIHWPIKDKMSGTWKALEHLREIGKVRFIGVCNFEVEHLELLRAGSSVVPFVNQIELHPRFQRPALVEYCRANHILIEAWAPLMRGGVFEIPELIEIGEKYQKTAGQVSLRWAIQRGFVPLPKSQSLERIRENFDVFDFELSEADMEIIKELNLDMRIGPDPETFSWEWPKNSKS